MSNLKEAEQVQKEHLRKLRIFLWVALLVISGLLFWWSEKGRYVHAHDNLILDTKTGNMHTPSKSYPKP